MQTYAQVLERAQGCWLGQLAGDSLGSLVEFQSAAAIAARYPAGVRDLADGGTWNTLAGQPTDDSELALMLARCLVKEGRFDAAKVLNAYVHWYESGPFDMGATTQAALGAASRSCEGADRLLETAAHANPSSQANGSLMRVSPLGIFGAGRPQRAAAWARADSALTHPHEVCQEACAAFVAALATAIAGGEGAEPCYRAALTQTEALGCPPAVRQALQAAAESPPRDYTAQMGWVLIALQDAFYQLLHAPSLEEGVVATVMAGGDTDTNGAIAGALLGAVHGREAIPCQWRRAVLSCRPLPQVKAHHPRPPEFWPVDAMELAETLLVAGATPCTTEKR